MKKTMKATISMILAMIFIVSLVACGGQKDLWEDATYQEDTTLGSGSKTVIVEVKVDEHLVTFTVKTDKDTVGAALLEHKLIAGEESQYGLFVKTVNGVTIDDAKQQWWCFTKDGGDLFTGVDTTPIADGDKFEITLKTGY